MKRRLLQVAAQVMVMVCAASIAGAKGLFVDPGARANGIGAFYGIADDATAIYWNPAGLTQLGRYGVEIAGWYEANNTKSNRSLMNAAAPDAADGDFALPRIYGAAEPDAYSKKEMETSAFFPFIAGYGKVKDVTVAAGYYVVGGGGGKWKDVVKANGGVDTIRVSLEATQQVFMVYNVSAARQVTPRLSAGLGIDWVTIDNKSELHKDYIPGTGSPLPGYSFLSKDGAWGSGFQLNAGLRYVFLENLQAGLVYRSGASLKMTGTNHYAQSGLALTAIDVQSEYDQTFNYPMTYGLGVAYEPAERWTLAAGFEQINYSTMKQDITYKDPIPGVFNDADADLGWKDTTKLSLGAAYKANEKLNLRTGILTDPTPYSRDKVTLTDVNQYDFVYYSLGADYDFGVVKAALTYTYGQSEKLNKGGRTYEFPMNMVYFSVGRTF
jgi:long-chain fatty acid transport protein